MMLMILVGIILGIVGRIFSTSLIALKTFFKNKIENPYKKNRLYFYFISDRANDF